MLSFNRHTGQFFLLARTPELVQLAKDTGLDQSLTATVKHGCPVYFTGNEYAALPFFQWADGSARELLHKSHTEYEASYGETAPDAVPCPSDRAYMPFQLAGVAYALSRPHALIGDQMGLGKTIQAIGVANALGAERVLVVCPANVRLQWQREVRAWSTLKRVSTYPIIKSADGTSPYANYVFVSYDLIRNELIHRGLMSQKWDLLVLDEAHYLKTVEANRTRAVFGRLDVDVPHLAENASKIVALTGTPLPNRPRECYTMARHLCWDSIDWMSEAGFRDRYNPSMAIETKRGYRTIEKQGRLPELRARLRCNFMVRRAKKAVLKQLPEKSYELTYIEPNAAIKRVLQAESLLRIDPEHLELTDPDTWGHISTVRKEMGVAKAPRVVEHVAMLVDGGLEKVVVFAHHKEVIQILEQKLGSLGIVKVSGSTSPVARQRAVDRFVADPACRVFLGQLQAAGVGVDGLQKVCSTAVFAEASWTPGENEQCVSRLDRHGQRNAVLAQFLVAPGSLDEKVLGTALRKLRVTHEALDGGDD